MTTVTGLRCEHSVNPLGVETPAPGLSWQMESDRRGAGQSAYRILVAGVPEKLEPDQADLWDSGWVESDGSVMIPYAGRRLRSRQRCGWRVAVRDETGRESFSEPAFWEMGLLAAGDW